jgi:hypothetical protein
VGVVALGRVVDILHTKLLAHPLVVEWGEPVGELGLVVQLGLGSKLRLDEIHCCILHMVVVVEVVGPARKLVLRVELGVVVALVGRAPVQLVVVLGVVEQLVVLEGKLEPGLGQQRSVELVAVVGEVGLVGRVPMGKLGVVPDGVRLVVVLVLGILGIVVVGVQLVVVVR